jgi:hypothetical protein
MRIVTRDEIVKHVTMQGRYSQELGCYYVRWAGKLYTSDDTGDLVDQIANVERAV